MKRFRLITICLLAALLVAVGIFALPMEAEAITSGDYIYTITNGDATITGYTGAGGNITLPYALGGYSVTAIGEEAFYDCAQLTGVTIPEGVTNIGKSAFMYCENLTSVTIPSSVTVSGQYAFLECDGLTDVYISDPSAWCKIAFHNDYGNPMKQATRLHILDAQGNEATALTLDDTVTAVPEYAFRGCTQLTTAAIADSVTGIGAYAFQSCSGLTTVTLGSRLADIGESAFASCEKLAAITIPDSVTSIGESAFNLCRGLTTVTIGNGVTSLPDSLFRYCSALTNITIADSVTTIGYGVFRNCTSLTSVTIPDSVTSIGASAFSGCGNLEEMTIPFVGGSQNTADIYGQPNSKIALFGYIFGTTAYEGGREVNQGFTKYTADGKLTTKEYSYTYQYSAYDGFGTPEDSYALYETLKYSSLQFNHYYSNYEKDPIAKDHELRALDYAIHKMKEVRGSESQLKELSAKLLWTNGEPLDEYRQTYYIPETLKKVTVTNADRIYFGAFSYCDFIEEIHITKADTKIHTSVFYGAASLQVFCLKGSALEAYILDGKRISGGRNGGKYITPEKPVILEVTDETVTLQRGSNLEYSIDGENWTESNVFTDLDPDTEYTFYQRYKSKQEVYYWIYNQIPQIIYDLTISNSDPSEGLTVSTKPALSGISISSLPTKLTYVEAKGDLNVRGGKLQLNYGEDYFEEIDLTADMVQGFDNTKIGPQTLTVTYRGFSATFDILIERKAVSSISVYTTPAKTTYIEGQEELDVSGGKLRIYYNNDTQEIINLTPEMVSGFDNTRIGYQYLTVTYAGKICSFRVYIDAIDYTITFLNWDGSVLSTKIYHRGDAVNAPVAPTKAADNTYTYAFAGWDKDVVVCDGDATYTATYTATYIDYTVVFKNWDGEVISSQTYHYGEVVAVPDAPTKEADNTYTYTFAGWDKTVVNCQGNATYTATYTPVYIDYIVVFKDWDGTVISSDTYHYGNKVVAPAAPTRPANNAYSYAFTGWDKAVVNCTGDATYTATYTQLYIDYTVVFKNWDGTVISSQTYHYGDVVNAPADPTKAADKTYTYAFAGWDTPVVDCRGNATYTATYTPVYIDYTVVFENWDGTVLSSQTYHYGDVVNAPADPVREADNVYSYTFVGWQNWNVTCTGDAICTATYISAYIDYTVVFKNWDGKVWFSGLYHWGDVVDVPIDPIKKADKTYTYTFAGWDKEVVACEGDAIYTATYTSTYINYTVVFKNWDGTILSEKTYHYGDAVTAPEAPTKEADNTYTYTFAGWHKEVVNCAGNTTYTATYTPSYIDYTVIFADWDGTVLSSQTYHWGDAVTAPEDPVREADNVYSYTFAGWQNWDVTCTGDAICTATYTSVYIDYLVRFEDWDGRVYYSYIYHWGDEVELPPDPLRGGDNTYTYTFAGWDREVVACAGNTTYTATYTPTYIDYTVTFRDWEGTILSSHIYHWGEEVEVPADLVRADDDLYSYTFIGWNEEVSFTCTGNVIYTAQYKATEKLNGWVLDDGNWYYYVDGVKQTGWVQNGSIWYYMDAQGVMQTGWQYIDRIWYYFHSSGNMATGWVKDGGFWYYMSSYGNMVTGWVKDGGFWYYMSSSGNMVTGWLQVGGTWYYFHSSGNMATGWVRDGGLWYYFYDSGAMATNTYVDGGWIDASGVWHG